MAWLNRCRRLAKYWEYLNCSGLAFLKLACILVARLLRGEPLELVARVNGCQDPRIDGEEVARGLPVGGTRALS
jgi:hypothetical protein